LLNPQLNLSLNFNLKRNLRFVVCASWIVCGSLFIIYDYDLMVVVLVRVFD